MPIRVLLVQPRTPKTYWGFQYALEVIGRRVSLPPLGLISVAALLPDRWELRLVDTNVRELTDDDLAWADALFLGGMLVQSESMHEILDRARRAGVRTVVGGPAVTSSPDQFDDADHLFLGEAEGRVGTLIRAIERPSALTPRVVSAGDGRPEMSAVPVPRFDLLDLGGYATLSVQYSRGCPFNCEFCDIVQLFGRKVRVKTPGQVLAELDAIYATGYRGPLFVVDDNFIGHRKEVARMLPHVQRWQRAHRKPFDLYTEADIELSGMPELTTAMVDAGFTAVFVGIESPSAAALAETNKRQNLKRDLSESVMTLTRAGLEVQAGFIVGFDSDDAGIFDAQLEFISELPIPLAMVGMLTALPGTDLHRRLAGEGRLREIASGDNLARPNFDPAMDEETLLRGYRWLMSRLYEPESFFRRCRHLIEALGDGYGQAGMRPDSGRLFARISLALGLRSPRTRRHYWRLVATGLRRGPHYLSRAVSLAAMGEHFIRYTAEDLLPAIDVALASVTGPSCASSSLLSPAA